MNARTTISAKGQVVIPKDVRNRLKLMPGDRLDVVERDDGVLLRRMPVAKSGRSADDIYAELRKLYTHRGPAASIADMDAAVEAEVLARARAGR